MEALRPVGETEVKPDCFGDPKMLGESEPGPSAKESCSQGVLLHTGSSPRERSVFQAAKVEG